MEAGKQLDAEIALEDADLAADRLAADQQLLAGAGKAEMPRRCFEGDQAVQRGKG